MFCTKCGSEVSEESRFCGKCGAKTATDEATAGDKACSVFSDSYATAACNCALSRGIDMPDEKDKEAKGSFSADLLVSFLEQRGRLAQEITSEYPGFREIYECIDAHDQEALAGTAPDIADMLISELGMMIDLFKEAEEEKSGLVMEIGIARLGACVNDMRFLILMTAYEAYYQDTKQLARNTLSNRCAEVLQDPSYQMSISGYITFIFALWFSDYPGFRRRVFELYPGFKAARQTES